MTANTPGRTTRGDGGSPDAIDVLGDEYACRILAALGQEPMAAVELAEACDASRATVYRRLDRLESAGLVASRTRLRPDGNHRKRFHLESRELRVSLTADETTSPPSRGERVGIAAD